MTPDEKSRLTAMRIAGSAFTAYGNSHRKYCCHECYIADRYLTFISGCAMGVDIWAGQIVLKRKALKLKNTLFLKNRCERCALRTRYVCSRRR